MDKAVRFQGDMYLWAIYGVAGVYEPWGAFVSGGGFYTSQWLTIGHRAQPEPNLIASIDLSREASYSDPRDADAVTIDVSNRTSVLMRGVEYVDSTLDTTSSLRHYSHFGFTTDGSLDSIDADIGNHEMFFTTAIKDSSLHLGGGWDKVRLEDHLDLPGTQYWSLIRREFDQVDAYSLVTGRRVRMEGGAEARTDDSGRRNYGEIEDVFLLDSRTSTLKKYQPGKAGTLDNDGDMGENTNIDLRSDGTAFSDSFNLAYFNFIRYTSDNVWVGEATIHDGTVFSTPGDKKITTAKYGYDAPILTGHLSVIGQSRNGTHDLNVREQTFDNTKPLNGAIDGKFRLYSFDVNSELYNEFNKVYLGTSGVDIVNKPGDNDGMAGTSWSDRVALYGFGGNDQLEGGNGYDYLFGGQSTFSRLVSDGNGGHNLIVDNGNQVRGGAGADYFGVGHVDADTGLAIGLNTLIGNAEIGSYLHGAATDRILDWDASADTLVVLANGVAVIEGLFGQANLTGDDLIDLREIEATAVSDQDFDGARGNDGWDAAADGTLEPNKSTLDYIFENQTDRDTQSIVNQEDVSVVNNGLIVLKGGAGDDSLQASDGKDYLYGNAGRNIVYLDATGDTVNNGSSVDRVYYDTRSGKQYVANFQSGVDQFYLARNVVDAFSPASRSVTVIDATVGETYTRGYEYDQNVTFIHKPIYQAMLSGRYGSGPYSNYEYAQTEFLADTATTAAGAAMNGIGSALMSVPFVGPALAIPFYVLGGLFNAGQALSWDWDPLSLIGASMPDPEEAMIGKFLGDNDDQFKGNQTFLGTGSHLNATYEISGTSFTTNYVYLLQSTAAVTSTAATDANQNADNKRFLEFFDRAETNDGFISVLELNPGADDVSGLFDEVFGGGVDATNGVYGYFAVHSDVETFVYLVVSQDNLIENSEAILVAEIEGILSAADFAVYDSTKDIYNQVADAAVTLIAPTITSVKNNANSAVIADRSLTEAASVRLDMSFNITSPADASLDPLTAGTVVEVYDAFDVRTVSGVTSAYKVASYTATGGETTLTLNDSRSLGQTIEQTDYDVTFAGSGPVTLDPNNPPTGTGDLNPLHLDNTFQYFDKKVSYFAVVKNDIGDDIVLDMRSNAYQLTSSGTSSETVFGGAGNDILFLSSTSSHLNNASDDQIVSIETIRALPGTGPILVTEVTGEQVTGITIVDPGKGLADGTYNISFSDVVDGTSGDVVGSGATGWQAVVSGGQVVSIIIGNAGSDYSPRPETSVTWAYSGLTIDLRNQGESGRLYDYDIDGDGTIDNYLGSDTLVAAQSDEEDILEADGFEVVGGDGADTIYASIGNDTIRGGDGADSMIGGGGDDLYILGTQSYIDIGETIVEASGGGDDTIRVDASLDLTNLWATSFANVEHLFVNGAFTVTLDGWDVSERTFDLQGLSGTTEKVVIKGKGGSTTTDLSGIAAGSNWADISDDVIIRGANGSNSVIIATQTSDLVYGGLGGSEAETIYGGNGNDTIYGYGGNDSLLGDAGSDSLFGGDGLDDLNGGSGNDTLSGGAGADYFRINAAGTYTDVITDLGAGGTDRVQLNTTGGGAVQATLAANFTADVHTFNRSGDEAKFVIYTNGYDINLSATPAYAPNTALEGGFTVLETGGVATTIVGSQHDDSLRGGVGNDRIDGGSDNDTIDGGAGNDTIIGGAGNDILNAGAGEDQITGGAGADTINLSADGADDLIVMSQSDGAGFGATSGWDVITAFNGSNAFTDLVEISDWVDRSSGSFIGEGGITVNSTNLGYLTAEIGDNTQALDETELLIVTNSSVSSLSEVQAAIESSYDLTGLDDGNILFSVKGAAANEWWFGVYNDVSSDDATALSEFKMLGQVTVTTGGFDFDDFWQPGVLLNIPPTVTTAYSALGPLVYSDEAGTIAHDGDTVSQTVSAFDASQNLGVLVGPTAPLSAIQTGVFSVTDSQGGTGTDTNNTIFTMGTDTGETLSGQYVWGFGGNDTITGTSGNDVLSGVAGDDVINPGAGADIIFAGPGADTVKLTADNAADVVYLSASAADTLANGYTASSVSVPTVFDFSTAQDTIKLTDFPGSNKQIIIGSTNLGANPYDKAALISTFSLDNSSYQSIKAGVLGTDGTDTFLYYWDDAGSGSLTSADTLSLMAVFKGITDLTAMNNALDIF